MPEKKESKKEEISLNIEELKYEIKSLTDQYNQFISNRDSADDMAKRCLGAIETIQKIIGRKEDNA